MKRILALLLAALMVVSVAFSLVSCGEEEKKTKRAPKKTPAELAAIVEQYVEDNKETVAEEGLTLEANGTVIIFAYTMSEEDYLAENSGELTDALKSVTLDNTNVKSMLEALEVTCPEVTGVWFEYRAPDGTVLATSVATGR